MFGATIARICGLGVKNGKDKPRGRRWRINTDKCKFCGGCAKFCVRTPSAVKAVNDQKKCSFCVVCYGHIRNHLVESSKVETEGIRVCPRNAVMRRNYSGGLDGYYIYTIDHSRCIACGACAAECNSLGSKSMFLIIRPDLCLGCNQCNIALKCPNGAVEVCDVGPEDDFRDEPWEAEQQEEFS